MITVTTFLWSDPDRAKVRNHEPFGPRHVVILRNMVRRNLTLDHEFVCVTDDDHGELSAEGIRQVPLDKTKHVPGTCLAKLMSWRPDIGGVLGERILCLDLDIVFVGNVDALFDRPEDVVLCRNPNFPKPGRAFYQGSIQFHTAGARPEIWDDFDPAETMKWLNWRFGGAEQCWLSERLSWQEAYWNQVDGIYGAGWLHDQQRRPQTKLPPNAKVIVFPGNRIPEQAEMQKIHPWLEEHYR